MHVSFKWYLVYLLTAFVKSDRGGNLKKVHKSYQWTHTFYFYSTNIYWLSWIFFIVFIELQLFYNVVFIFAVQQNDLVIYIYTFFIFFSIVVYCRIVNGVPWAPLLFLSSKYNSLHLLTPDS